MVLLIFLLPFFKVALNNYWVSVDRTINAPALVVCVCMCVCVFVCVCVCKRERDKNWLPLCGVFDSFSPLSNQLCQEVF